MGWMLTLTCSDPGINKPWVLGIEGRMEERLDLAEDAFAWISLLSKGHAFQRAGLSCFFRQRVDLPSDVVEDFAGPGGGLWHQLKSVHKGESVKPVAELKVAVFDLVCSRTDSVQSPGQLVWKGSHDRQLHRGAMLSRGFELQA